MWKLTKRIVGALPVTGAEYIAWDNEITGFGVRVRASGAKTDIVQYQAGAGRKAPTRKLTLGAGWQAPKRLGRLPREKAVGAIAHGQDPAGARADERPALTVAELIDVFLTRPR
jgi:hypothetical protein